jgi:hypothetical protein
MLAQRSTNAAGRGVSESRAAFQSFRTVQRALGPGMIRTLSLVEWRRKASVGTSARYAGRDGRCYPTMKTLGQEIGVGERQAQKYVAELERHGLLRRVSRYVGGAQTSNGFEFLWHELFEEGVNDRSGGRANDQSGEGVIDRSPKENQSEESHIEESHIEEKTINKRPSGYASQDRECVFKTPKANLQKQTPIQPLWPIPIP